MEGYKLKPFNLSLLIPDSKLISTLGEVKELSIFKQTTKEFNENGLFSTTIFERVGSDTRNKTFGFIDLKVKIIHPLIYKSLISLKALYKDILEGNKYATWDKEKNDFVYSDSETGETGYTFFMSHYDELDFGFTESEQRDAKIKLIKRYSKAEVEMSKMLVLPAGLRDYIIKDNKPSEDEINEIYRKIMVTTNTLNNIRIENADKNILDSVRARLQSAISEVYDYIIKLTDGKKKFIQGKWASRAIANGTRNVITALPLRITDLNDKANIIGLNDTVIGLHQYTKAILPITKHRIKAKFMSQIFSEVSTTAKLVDPENLKTITVEVDYNVRDEWLSFAGINSIINKLAQEELRILPVMINQFYLLLVWDNGKEIMPVFNTNTLGEEYNPKFLRPITYAELLYLTVYEVVKTYPCLVTRYPVTGQGSIYPSSVYLRTTVKGRAVTIIDPLTNSRRDVIEYPDLKERFFNSVSVHFTKLAGLGGDYDGDMISVTVLATNDSVDEINELFNTREYYLTPDNKLASSIKDDILTNVVTTLTM